jgi:predicted amidohydrolase YtcJ
MNTIVFMQGLGNEYFWYGGAQGSEENGTNCSSLTPRVTLSPGMLACGLEPGTPAYNRLYKFIKNGGRMAIAHTIADRDIDHILDLIEKASKEAGFTLEQVRAKRHGFDHLALAPRPDQIPRIKELGMVTGGNAIYPYEMAQGLLAAYGEKPLEWMNPKKSLVDAQIPTGFEVDRPISGTDLTMFWVLARSMDRKAVDGRVYGPSQKIGRELALKTITTWGAYYLMKEDTLGSLASGKAADFVVLDRDYLTIPEADIEKLRVFMTVVGGRVVHLVPSLAKEIGMKPIGAQVELSGSAAQW